MEDTSYKSKKRHVIIVKSLQQSSSSPKRSIKVSRKPKDDESLDFYDSSNLGNMSPTQPAREGGLNIGNILSRSILGDPKKFEMFQKQENFNDQDSKDASITSSKPKTTPGSRRSSTSKSYGRVTNMVGDKDLNRKQALDDPGSDPELYLALLKEKRDEVNEQYNKTLKKEETSLEKLPYHEKLEQTKESKIISRWQERQKDWENIQMKLSKRINNSKLMMTSERLNEFRSQNEKYALLLACMPTEERYSSSNWTMSLRGGGNSTVSVGHIFSGLQCEISTKTIVPPIVRKPIFTSNDYNSTVTGSYSGSVRFNSNSQNTLSKLSHTSTKDSMAVNIDDPVAKKKLLKLEKAMKTLRPHEAQTEDTDGLFLKSVDLFDWAIQSSKEFFNHGSRTTWIEGPQHISIDAEHVESIAEPYDAGSIISHKLEPKIKLPSVATIDFKSPREIVFHTRYQTRTSYHFKFENNGTVAIEYNWYSDPAGSQFRGSNKNNEFSQILNSRSITEYSREKLLANNRSQFFCSYPKGIILPGQTVVTTFDFQSDGSPGIFSQNWRFNTTPQVEVSFQDIDSFYNAASSTSLQPAENYLTQVTPVKVSFHGQAVFVDETNYLRRSTLEVIDKREIKSFCVEVIEESLKKVRTPLRVETINLRKKEIFEEINQDLLSFINKRFGKVGPFYITPERINNFQDLFHRVNNFIAEISKSKIDLRRALFNQKSFGIDCPEDIATEVNISEEDLISFEQNLIIENQTVQNNIDCSIKKIKNKIFPEEQLECFDEISGDVLETSWDYNVIEIIKKLSDASETSRTLYSLEVLLQKRKKAQAKAEAKDARIKARLAAIDSDEEDDGDAYEDEGEEDEEEEEEEDDEETKKIDKATLHPYYLNSQSLLNQCHDILNLLNICPLKSNLLSSSINKQLHYFLDGFEALDMSCKRDLSIDPALPIPAMPSPYTSDEGNALWTTLLAPKVEEVVDPKAKKAPPKDKGKDKKNTTAGSIDPETADAYHLALYKSIYSGLINHLEIGLGESELNSVFTKSNSLCMSNVRCIQNVASIRDSDVSNQPNECIYLRFAGEAFLSKSLPQDESFPYPVFSAFDQIDRMRIRALEPVLKLAQNGVKTIVLTHESLSPCDSLIDHRCEIGELLQNLSPQMPMPDSKEQRKRDRQIRKREKYLAKAAKRLRKAERNLRRREIPIESDARLLPTDEASLPKIDPYPNIYTYTVIPCKTMAELEVFLQDPTFYPEGTVVYEPIGGPLMGNTPNQISIYLLEDMARSGVVPSNPPFYEQDSDDEEGVIPLGLEEFKISKLIAYKKAFPYHVSMPVNCSHLNGSMKVNQTIDIFSENHAALNEAYMRTQHVSPLWIEASSNALFLPFRENSFFKSKRVITTDELREIFVWCGVISSFSFLCLIKSISTIDHDFDRVKGVLGVELIGCRDLVHPENSSSTLTEPYAKVILGNQIAESKHLSNTLNPNFNQSFWMLWDGNSTIDVEILETNRPNPIGTAAFDLSKINLNNMLDLSVNNKPLDNSNGGELSVNLTYIPLDNIKSQEVEGNFSFIANFNRLFPNTAAPNFKAFIGGKINSEKLRVIDTLLDNVTTLILGGEVMIPFLALGTDEYSSNNISVLLPEYMSISQRYSSSCIELRKKARRLGVRLLLPIDLVTGDQLLSENDIKASYKKCDPEARDEGMDYEGATKVVNISESMKTLQGESNTSILEIKDHIYDVGQATISEITTEISTSDLFFIWGTSGVCEVGPFQNSMKNIVVSSSNRDWIPANTTTQSEVNKPHVLVLGDSTCEWFLRFIDPDGSETKGDLVGRGVVAFACRSSLGMVGVLGEYNSNVLSNIERRPVKNENEWKYNILKASLEDQDEEEEEEEDDEEDE